jgi:hypothetical protein
MRKKDRRHKLFGIDFFKAKEIPGTLYGAERERERGGAGWGGERDGFFRRLLLQRLCPMLCRKVLHLRWCVCVALEDERQQEWEETGRASHWHVDRGD